MELTRTRRILNKDPRVLREGTATTYAKALKLLNALDIIQEDAEESLEDQMRLHQQSITTDDVTVFVERSVGYLTQTLMEIGDMEQLLTIIIEHDKDAFEKTLSSLRKKIDEARANREHWREIGDDLGDLDDHPF